MSLARISLLCCLLAVGPLRGWAADFPVFGPLFSEFGLTLEPGKRTEIAGPLFYQQAAGTQRGWGVPPLFSSTRDPAVESQETDFLYPVMTYDRYGRQYRWQLFQLLSIAGGPTQTETVRDRFTLFPIFFYQRSSDPSENYTGYGPFYGHLKNRLMRDEIFYVMFPFFAETRKRDIVTDNYLFPIFHKRTGDHLTGWQAWPLVGHESKGITFTTNGFGDVTVIGGHERWFAVWPIWFNQYNDIGTPDPKWQSGFLPAYSVTRSPQRDATTVLWPFFSKIDDREQKYVEWQTPWPFVIFARGEGKTTSRVFPFYGHSQSTNLTSDFYAWPIYKYKAIHAAPLDRRRHRILFFLYSDLIERNTETQTYRRRIDFLPFFTRQREMDGSTRLQVLAVLEPFLPANKSIERDYSPIWSLWRSQNNVKTGAASQSLLWNLYRHESKPEEKKTSLLFGLFRYVSGSDGKQVRLFFIPFGHSQSAANPTPAPDRGRARLEPKS